MKKNIYLDYAATTPVDKEVLKTMLPYFSDNFGNASSLHNFGEVAHVAVEKAREETANFFEADNQEVIFTSGATEANNLAIKGVVRSYHKKNNLKPHIITTSFEHHCVLNTVKSLEKDGLIEATFINPQKDGVIKVEDIEKAIKKNTILISVMYVNNEIGTLQPIAKIARLIKKIKKENYPLFHTDATQALSYFNCNVKKLGVDLLSMSAHKIYGPKGVGVLYVKKGTPIKKIQDGGKQENGLRSGTINSTGIVGLGKAISMLKNKDTVKDNQKIKELRNYFIQRVLKEIPKTKLNGSKIKRSPNNINFSFESVEGESLIMMLDAEGIATSTGSACSSGSLQPSHVLLSIGLKPEQAHGSLRITLGKQTTKKEIDITVKKLKKIIQKLREVAGLVLEEYYKINKK